MDAETLLDFQEEIEGKYDGLRMFTLETLASEAKKTAQLDKRLTEVEKKLPSMDMSDIVGLDVSINSMREEIEQMKRSSANQDVEDEAHESEPQKKKRASVLVVEDGPSIPRALDHIKDPKLRISCQKYYCEKTASSERLTPAQVAFVHYYLFQKKSGKASGKFLLNIT